MEPKIEKKKTDIRNEKEIETKIETEKKELLILWLHLVLDITENESDTNEGCTDLERTIDLKFDYNYCMKRYQQIGADKVDSIEMKKKFSDEQSRVKRGREEDEGKYEDMYYQNDKYDRDRNRSRDGDRGDRNRGRDRGEEIQNIDNGGHHYNTATDRYAHRRNDIVNHDSSSNDNQNNNNYNNNNSTYDNYNINDNDDNCNNRYNNNHKNNNNSTNHCREDKYNNSHSIYRKINHYDK